MLSFLIFGPKKPRRMKKDGSGHKSVPPLQLNSARKYCKSIKQTNRKANIWGQSRFTAPEKSGWPALAVPECQTFPFKFHKSQTPSLSSPPDWRARQQSNKPNQTHFLLPMIADSQSVSQRGGKRIQEIFLLNYGRLEVRFSWERGRMDGRTKGGTKGRGSERRMPLIDRSLVRVKGFILLKNSTWSWKKQQGVERSRAQEFFDDEKILKTKSLFARLDTARLGAATLLLIVIFVSDSMICVLSLYLLRILRNVAAAASASIWVCCCCCLSYTSTAT